MSSINGLSSYQFIEKKFKTIERNERWIKTAKKVELGLMGVALLAILSGGFGGAFIGFNSLTTTTIVLISTTAGLAALLTLSTCAIKGARTHLDSQKKRLQEDLSGKQLVVGMVEAFQTDELSADTFYRPLLKKMTDRQWTLFVIELDEVFSKKKNLNAEEKGLLKFIGSFPTALADNLFFISKPTMKHLLHNMGEDRLGFEDAVKGSIHLLHNTYFNQKKKHQAKFRDIGSYKNFLGALTAHFGGIKPAPRHHAFMSKEIQAREERCIRGMHNLSQTLSLILNNDKMIRLLNVWQHRSSYFLT